LRVAHPLQDVPEKARGVLDNTKEDVARAEQAGGNRSLQRLGGAGMRHARGDDGRRQPVVGKRDEYRVEHRRLPRVRQPSAEPHEQVIGRVARRGEHDLAAPGAALRQRGRGCDDPPAGLAVRPLPGVGAQPDAVGRLGDGRLEQLGDRADGHADHRTSEPPAGMIGGCHSTTSR